jgi:metallo-beta-lactamase family protein
MESTYGDRNHDTETGSYTKELAKIIDETLGKGGNVVIPSFAVGRTQELLYFIRQMKEEGLVTANPDFPVYVDSPLAEEATRIFSGDLTGYLDEEAIALVKTGIGMLSFPGLNLCKTTEESKRLNEDGIPKVIISASGMCDAGRIRHHLKHNLWRRECTVVFVGFQAVGSLGRHLLDGASSVKMFGEEIAVNASIVNFKGLSSHADMTALTEWICAFSPRPKHVFVVHGDADVIPRFVNRLQEIGISAHGPNWMEEYDLVKGITVREGVKPKEKKHVQPGMSPAYAKLLDTEKQLLSVIQKNSGLSNKDLAKFTDQLRAIIYKWER